MKTRLHSWLPFVAGALITLAGCSDGARDVGYMDDDDFPGNCGASGSGTGCDTDGTGEPVPMTTTGPVPSGCQVSGDCMGGYCIAPFDPETAQVGEFDCSFTCVALMDESSWCSDDSACCDPDAVCTGRGYCLLPEDATTTDSDTTTGDSTSSTGDGGSGSTGTTGGG